jgi:hypothetical protein
LEFPVKRRKQYWLAISELAEYAHNDESNERTCWVHYMLLGHFNSVHAKLNDEENNWAVNEEMEHGPPVASFSYASC